MIRGILPAVLAAILLVPGCWRSDGQNGNEVLQEIEIQGTWSRNYDSIEEILTDPDFHLAVYAEMIEYTEYRNLAPPHAQQDSLLPYSFVEFKVLEVFVNKTGAEIGETIEVSHYGGIFNGIRYFHRQVPYYQEKDRVILFLYACEDFTYETLSPFTRLLVEGDRVYTL